MEKERRQQERQTAEPHLDAFELHSGRNLGRVVDLSTEGFMLFSEELLNADSLWEFRLVPTQTIEGIEEIRLGADCLWQRPGADGQHCWAGFHIIDLAEEQAQALKRLLKGRG